MKRVAVIMCFLLAAAGVFWLFPLFHVVRLDELQGARQQAVFNAATFAESFWDDRLLPSLDQAADTATLLAGLGANGSSAQSRRGGRRVGMGRTTLHLLRGSGTVVQIDKKGVAISLTGKGSDPDVVLHTGLVFGNTARDVTGLLDVSDFANSQEFNDISTELNRIIEVRVIPTLKINAVLGRKIRFVGCAEVPDSANNVRPLTIIPLVVSVE